MTSMVRVAFAGTFAASLEARVRSYLAVPCDVLVADEASIAAKLADVDVLVTLAFTREMAAAAPRLRLVQVPGAGLDRIDRAAVPPTTWLANAYGHEVGIAEYIVAVMLAWTRDLGRLDAALHRGTWLSQWAVGAPAPPTWPELAGRTLGIVGYGRIGRCLAQRARAFDMTVLATRRDVSTPDGLVELHGPDGLHDVLVRSDYVAITASLSAETRGLIGERELAAMKPTAVLINVARGEIVNEEALYRALETRTIAGAALDVWYRYPTAAGVTWPGTLPFHELPNVLMTPHVSGWTDGMLEARARLIADNIARAARGEPPVNLIR
jgi:phosphoglycerate dehydrogenase-like enzyme